MRILVHLAAAALSVAFAGCVSIIHDKTAGGYRPAQVGLKEFAGTYKDKAVYSTPPNAMGFTGSDSLGEVLRGIKFSGDVRIQVTDSRSIIVTGAVGGAGYPPIHYKEGEDFRFENHSVIFSPDRAFGSDDSPVIGIASQEIKWMIDDHGRLVTITNAGGAGLVTIIPMVALGRTVAVFERK